MKRETIEHPIPPLYDAYSKVLILGSFPSVKTREMAFSYGHPQNRFWPVLGALFGETIPGDVPGRRRFLLSHRIACWDVIASCDIEGSSDASIRNAVPTDLRPIFRNADIAGVFTNGGTADAMYRRHHAKVIGMPATRLPSTSPANAAWSLERLIEDWRIVKTTIDHALLHPADTDRTP